MNEYLISDYTNNKISMVPILVILIVFILLTFGFIFGTGAASNKIQRDVIKKAVEMEAAYYHPKTGEISWNNSTVGEIFKEMYIGD